MVILEEACDVNWRQNSFNCWHPQKLILKKDLYMLLGLIFWF